MNSDPAKRLRAYRESATLLEGEYNELSAIIKAIEALEGELATEKGTADRALMARDKAEARAERLRVALERIEGMTTADFEYRKSPLLLADFLRSVARKALEDDKQ
jgi:hypothetical protein